MKRKWYRGWQDNRMKAILEEVIGIGMLIIVTSVFIKNLFELLNALSY